MVSPDMLLLTDKGHIPIRQLAGQTVRVWSGTSYIEKTVIRVGVDQPIIRVVLEDGRILDCSPFMKWYTHDAKADPDETEKTKYFTIMKRAYELQRGTKVVIFHTGDEGKNKTNQWMENREILRVKEVMDLKAVHDIYTVKDVAEPKPYTVQYAVFNHILTGQ